MSHYKDLNLNEESALLLFNKMKEDNKGKTFMEILPKNLLNKKRSLIKKYIIHSINRLYDIANTDTGKHFFPDGLSKETIAQYAMIGDVYSNFYLSRLFFETPHEWTFSLKFFEDRDFKPDLIKSEEYKEFKLEHEHIYQFIREFTNAVSSLTQDYESYLSREDIRLNREVVSVDDFEDDLPRLSRGNLCRYFIPVEGLTPSLKGEITLKNPRNNKEEVFTIIKESESCTYKVKNERDEIKYLTSFTDVYHAYDALFSINKEIYSGWWNRKLIM